MHILAPLAALAALASAAPQINRRYTEQVGEIHYDVFEHAETGAKLQYVTNSGICETTPGVNQYSGYITTGTNASMWFWFFEARNNPSTAPLVMWLNGGPGCSSMLGLFQENGPCQFYNGSSTPSLNPYSWNTYANMLYVDQPIGTGFSYGTDNVTSTVAAAPPVWTLIQAFYAAFPTYESREFGLWTESYGGHYGPQFADYFQTQNAAIAAGKIKGDNIDLVALGINNGWLDPAIQFKAYLDYAVNNTYKQLITESQYTTYLGQYNSQCVPLLNKCTTTTGSNSACLNADNTCGDVTYNPVTDDANFDVYDVREPYNDPYPPETYVDYLQTKSIMNAIGAQSTYQECPDNPYNLIINTGDDARPFLNPLSAVVKTGINILLWAGDADWICNWIGYLASANTLNSTFANTATTSYTVGGVAHGLFKTVGNLNWLQVYEAGHEVPYYQPEAALQAFWQIMQKQPLSST